MTEFNPYEEQEVEQAQAKSPYEPTIKPTPNLEKNTGYEAITIAAETGTDPVTAYTNAALQGVDMVHEEYKNNAANTLEASYSAYVEGATRQGMLNDPAHVQALQHEYNQDLDRVTNPKDKLAPYRAYVISTPRGASLSPAAVDKAAAQNYVDNLIASTADDLGVYDWVNALALPDLTYNLMRIGEEFLGKEKLSTTIDPHLMAREFANKFSSMPALAQVEVADSVAAYIEDLEGSKLNRADLLTVLLGREDSGSILGNTELAVRLDQQSAAFGVWGIPKLASGVLGAMRGINGIKKAIMGGNDTAAAHFTTAAMKNGDAAADLGITKIEATEYINPLLGPDLPGLLKGADEGVAQRITQKIEGMDAAIAEGTNILHEGLGIPKATRMEIASREVTNIKARPGVDGVKIDFVDSEKAVITFKTSGKEGTYTRDFTLDDISGTVLDSELGFVSSLPGAKHVLSPNTMFGKDSKTFLDGLTRGMVHTSAKVRQGFVESYNIATKGLGNKSMKRLDGLLQHGADHKKVYTADEAINVGVGGVRYTEKEYESYTAMRHLLDMAWHTEDTNITKAMRAQGIKNVDIGSRTVHAKDYADSTAANKAYAATADFNKVAVKDADGSLSTIATLDKAKLDEFYADGYVLSKAVKTEDNLLDMGDDLVGWVLTPRTAVGRLDGAVLGYTPGHVPRIYNPTKARVFVKQRMYKTVDGVPDTAVGMKTLAYTDDITEAEGFMKAHAANNSIPSEDLVVRYDREMTQAELDSDILSTWGGLYRGPKNEEALEFLRDGGKFAEATVSPFESIQRYVNHIGNKTSMTQLRLGTQEKWLKWAKETGALPAHSPSSFGAALGIVENAAIKPAVKAKLLDAHKTIDFINKVPTLGEQEYAGALRKVADGLNRVGAKYGDALVGKGLKAVAKGVQRVDDISVVNGVKAATFHTYLGMGNISQILVQASGMTIAASVNPVAFAKGIKHIMPMSQLDNIQDASLKAAVLKKMKTVKGQEGVAEMYEAWNKSGLYQSIIRSNADAYALATGAPITQGAVGKLLNAGLLPYKLGETANTRTSFATAFEWWKGNPKNAGKALDDDAIKEIVARTDAYRLHMNQVDKAAWQKGLLSLPTQFMSVSAKYLQAMIPGFSKDWTAAERSRLVLGQAGLLGAAGVPFGTYVLEEVLEQTGLLESHKDGTNPISPELLTGLQRGVVGWVMNDYFDIDAVVTGRVAIGEGITNMYMDFIGDPTSAPATWFLGASSGVIDKSLTAFQSILNAGKIAANNWDDMTQAQAGVLMERVATSLLDVPSSSSKLLLAMALHNSPQFKLKDGTHMLYVDRQNAQTSIFQATGFTSQQLQDIYAKKRNDTDIANAKSAAASMIMSTLTGLVSAADGDAELESWAYDQTISLAVQAFPNPAEQRAVMELVRKKLKRGDPIGKHVADYMTKMSADFGHAANNLNPTLIKLQEEKFGGE